MIQNRSFRVSWVGLSVYLLLMTLLCSLGVWQLNRSEQKKQFLTQQREAIEAETIDLNQQPEIDAEAFRYRKIVAAGYYDQKHQFLLDNQVVDGKNGYFVMTPFFVDGHGAAVLVNRGWVAFGKDRNSLPDVGFDTRTTKIKGRINRFPSVGLKLKGAEIPTETWPSVVQVIDANTLSEKLAYPLEPYQLELDPVADDGYKRDWKIAVPIPPEKHVAYAVQWFGLALTLTVLFIWISIRKNSEQSA